MSAADQTKRLADYVRGFAAASKLSPDALAGVYAALALQQCEEQCRSDGGEPLTLELWAALMLKAWRLSGRLACEHCSGEHQGADCPVTYPEMGQPKDS